MKAPTKNRKKAVKGIQFVTDDAGKGYTYNMPKNKVTGSAHATSGLDQDNMIRADWQAVETAVVITRIP